MKDFSDAVQASKTIIIRRPTVTIAKNRSVILNSGLLTDLRANKPYVKLLFSRKNKTIILQFTDQPEGAIKINNHKSEKTSNRATITARNFFNEFEINLEATTRFEPEFVVDPNLGEIWTIDLSKHQDY